MCACWVWGYNNNPDCKKDKFKDDSEGCCWLKRRDDDGGLCAKEASKTHASAQTFGLFGDLPHEGGLPDDGSTGWAAVFGLLGIIFAVSAYSRVSPAFARNIFSLAADGVQFTLSGGRGRGGDDGGGGYSSIAGASEAPTAAAREPAGRDKRAAFADSRGRGGGERTALHAAAAVGDTHSLQKLLRSQAKLLDAGDSRNYTAFHVACAGGHVECVKALCQAGCDTEVVNDVGLTGWELAAQLQRTKINALDKGELEVRAPPSSAAWVLALRFACWIPAHGSCGARWAKRQQTRRWQGKQSSKAGHKRGANERGAGYGQRQIGSAVTVIVSAVVLVRRASVPIQE